MEEVTSGLSNHCMAICEGQGQEGSWMMAIDDPPDDRPPWELDQDYIEADNIVPGMASHANQMLMQYGGCDLDRIKELEDCIKELELIVPHGLRVLAENPGNGRPSELQNHVQNGIWMTADQRIRLQHILRCLQGVGPFGHRIGPECAIMIPKPQPNVVALNALRETASPPITENELRKTASPQMCALENLDYSKRFLILSYLCQ